MGELALGVFQVQIQKITSKALTRSSLVWEADMHIRALAKRSGVAGKATVTTATCNSISEWLFSTDTKHCGSKVSWAKQSDIFRFIKIIWLLDMSSTRTYIMLETFTRKSRDFCWIVQHYGHYRRIIIPKNLETHLLQLWPEKIAVFTYSCKFLCPCIDNKTLLFQSQNPIKINQGISHRGIYDLY